LKEIEIDCAVISVLESGIILIKYRSDYEVDLKDVKEVEKSFIRLSEGGDIYCIMDTCGRFNVYTKKAQNFLAKEASLVKEGRIKCSAVVIDNLPYRLITKFFIKFFKPSFQMKIFSNEKEATSWLKREMEKAMINSELI
jgi:hypothetical protein